LAQQEQEAKALDQQFNPQPTPVATIAVAPEDMPTAPLNQDVDPAQTIADQAKEAKAAITAIDTALAAPLGKGGIGADATAAPGPATAADLSDAVATALSTLSPAQADALGEQGKAALAAAMNNALGQFGPPAPPAPAPSISAVTGFTSPPSAVSPGQFGFAPPGIPGNLGLNLPNTPSAALPGPATSIGTPAVAASFQGFSPSPPGVVGVAAPPASQEADPASLAARNVAPPMNPAELGWAFNPNPTAVPNLPSAPTIPGAIAPTSAAFSPAISAITGFTAPPGPPSMQGFAPPGIPGNLGLNLPNTPPSQADSLAAEAAAQAKAALAAAQAAKGFTPSPNMFGAPASGNIGAPAIGTGHAPVGLPSSFGPSVPAPTGQLGSNISGFAAGSALGNFAATAGPVAAEAVSVGFPPTAAIAMQALFNTPLRA
jgi:hypothetical protein